MSSSSSSSGAAPLLIFVMFVWFFFFFSEENARQATITVDTNGDIVEYVDADGITQYTNTAASPEGLVTLVDTNPTLYTNTSALTVDAWVPYRYFKDEWHNESLFVTYIGEPYEFIDAFNYISEPGWADSLREVDLFNAMQTQLSAYVESNTLRPTRVGTVIEHVAEVSSEPLGPGEELDYLCVEHPLEFGATNPSTLLNDTLLAQYENPSFWTYSDTPCGVSVG